MRALLFGLVFVPAAAAQTVSLVETPREGSGHRVTATTTLAGALKVNRDGKIALVKVSARNEHVYDERVVKVERGSVRHAARFYTDARATAQVDGSPVSRELSADHRLIVAQRTEDGLVCHSPAGPLTRSELEVVSEHFDTLALAGLLPGKEVAVGDTWKLEPAAAQALCLFDGLVSHELVGKLSAATAATATISISGTAKGIENGAMATLTVAATATFDRSANAVVAVEWKQSDVREQGPVSPAADIETVTQVKREAAGESVGLTSEILTKIAAVPEPPAALLGVVHRDPRSRFQMLHGRDWHVVGQTDHHYVLRLLDRGDFVVQATLTPWKNAGAGKHLTPQEFEELVSVGTGWTMQEVVDRSEVPSDSDRWVYRIVAKGELSGSKVVQSFYIVAAADGSQMIATFTARAATAARVGTRDAALVNSIEFPKSK